MSEQINNVIPIDWKHLNPVERDFLQIVPERFQTTAWTLYKDYRKLACFTSVFERSKMTTAWMSGFVTAIHLADKEPDPPPLVAS